MTDSRNSASYLELIIGPMYSKKSSRLVEIYNQCNFCNISVAVINHSIDTRYDETKIVSHDTNAINSTPVENSAAILLLAKDVDVVGIDEAQFFDDGIREVCEQLALRGIRVIVAGLDMDYMGQPFGQMPDLLAVADYITKLHAICMECGNIAHVSYRKTAQSGQVLLGEKDIYEPRCRICAQK